MSEYLAQVNSGWFYLIAAVVLAYITVLCVVFLVKSYRAGIKLGMDKKVLKKTITASATFTMLPSISILLGVIALSGTLGVPFSWLRLSVVGALQYELSMGAFVTIALVMTVGILGGVVCCILFLRKYLGKIQKAPKKENNGKPGFGAHATTAMFVGLCAAYIGSYIGKVIPRDGQDVMPLFVAVVAALVMAVFEYFIQKKGKAALENFSLAASMLVAMAAAVLLQMVM